MTTTLPSIFFECLLTTTIHNYTTCLLLLSQVTHWLARTGDKGQVVSAAQRGFGTGVAELLSSC